MHGATRIGRTAGGVLTDYKVGTNAVMAVFSLQRLEALTATIRRKPHRFPRQCGGTIVTIRRDKDFSSFPGEYKERMTRANLSEQIGDNPSIFCAVIRYEA